MSFDDYLDMYSALSEQATRDVKTAYAFRIYDFDGDGVIGMKYQKNIINTTTSNSSYHINQLRVIHFNLL